jgi:trimethylamine--corrinoid protein Co-methyltransferase
LSKERPPIEPIRTSYKLDFLDDEQLDNLQEATLNILENTGVQFPSEKALAIFAEHGAEIDHNSQIVKIPRHLVLKAMSTYKMVFPSSPLMAAVIRSLISRRVSRGHRKKLMLA